MPSRLAQAWAAPATELLCGVAQPCTAEPPHFTSWTTNSAPSRKSMNEKLKQRQLGWLREDQLTRDVCPNVSTRDWVPCYLYRQPLNAKLKPFRTAFLWAANSP